MPSAPKLTDRLWNVGEIKILGKFKTKHSTEAYRHIRVSGEIAINLEGEEDRPHQEGKPLIVCRMVIDDVDENRKTVIVSRKQLLMNEIWSKINVGDIIEEIENENILCELIKHKAWEVRYSLVGRASHIMLLVLERDDDERVQRVAVEKHAIELITLAEIIAKNNMLRLNAIAEA